MLNVIGTRIQELLSRHLPYSLLEDVALMQIAASIRVQYREKGKRIFSNGNPVFPVLYFVAEGAVALSPIGQQQDEWYAEGDTFGLEALDGAQVYSHSAVVVEEALLYEIPLNGSIRSLLTAPAIRRFFRGNHPLESLEFNVSKANGGVESSLRAHELVWCLATTSIVEAARAMSKWEVGSIVIVDAKKHPVGIVTDKDLRKRVATGDLLLDTPIAELMSKPVITAPMFSDVIELYLLMLRHRIRHICITEDGTTNSPANSIVSFSDVLLAHSDSMGLLLYRVVKASSLDELELLAAKMEPALKAGMHRPWHIGVLGREAAEFLDALTERAIELTIAQMEAEGLTRPATPFCWLALGSAARREQLLKTDQDNALIFADINAYGEPWAPAFFAELGARVNEVLLRCGYVKCPGGLMAGNPAHCLCLEDWKVRFSNWVHTPTKEALLELGVFFDFRQVYGALWLGEELHSFIQQLVHGVDTFWMLFAADALHSPPPLNFFRRFIVEPSGEHKKEFDFKARAITPFVDAVRVLALHSGFHQSSGTLDRLQWLSTHDKPNAGVYQMAADAFQFLMGIRMKEASLQGGAGRYSHLDTWNQMDLAMLRNVFIPLRALHQIVRIRFQTAIQGV